MATPSSARKRKAHTSDHASLSSPSPTKVKKPKTAGTSTGKKRLRRYRSKPPQSFHEVFHRATTQRFYVLGRRRCGTPDAPEEEIELTGSTGNVMSRVLRAKFEHTYQLALVPSELKEIFDKAPPIDTQADNTKDKNRKPINGDCPICFCELESDNKETIVWCREACGQNIHKECFETWAATKRRGSFGSSDVTCPYCRSIWQGSDDMIKNIKKGGKITREGYVNVAEQLSISTQRDYIENVT
ncbi:SWIM zinc finger protein [Colletotrichum salicis]|uniref:SWIM zinc finger protein n=1 Tax=Colletotrichum salicis TaxID=1209931 RepID=A0A135SXN9_9PEZI|nr:SWIM zinc finger protein [Colletotrichum salicis]